MVYQIPLFLNYQAKSLNLRHDSIVNQKAEIAISESKKRTSKHKEPAKNPKDNYFAISVATSIYELEQAFSLVYKRYLASGYMKPNSSGMRFSLLEILPTSHVFVAKTDEQISATGTIVKDSEAGLPSEKIFKKELDVLRDEGRTLAEGTMFAASESLGKKSRSATLAMAAEAAAWCINSDIDDLIIVVNPKHLLFWTRFMGLEQIKTEKRDCSHVEGHPGLLLRLNTRAIRLRTEKLPKILNSFITADGFRAPYLHPEYDAPLAIETIKSLIEKEPKVLSTATQEQLMAFIECYDEFEGASAHTMEEQTELHYQ